MGWRDVMQRVIENVSAHGSWPDNEGFDGCVNLTWVAMMEQSDSDRIALARELLEGTGRVMAMDVGKVPAQDTPLLPSAEPIRLAFRAGWASGYNACRAVMLEDTK